MYLVNRAVADTLSEVFTQLSLAFLDPSMAALTRTEQLSLHLLLFLLHRHCRFIIRRQDLIIVYLFLSALLRTFRKIALCEFVDVRADFGLETETQCLVVVAIVLLIVACL